MKLVKLASAGAALALKWATPVFAQDAPPPAAEIALAHEVIDLGYPADKRETMFFASMDQMMGQMREAVLGSLPQQDPGALAILDKWLTNYSADSKIVLRQHIPGLLESIALAYADMFSETELRDLRDFLASPSGHGFLARNTDILANPHFSKANQDYMNAVMARLPAAQSELRDELTAYLEAKAAKTK